MADSEDDASYSWDDYCEDIKNDEMLSGIVIVGKDGGIWGKAGEPELLENEVDGIISFLSKKDAGNITVGGNKYIYLREVDDMFCFKYKKISLCVYNKVDFIVIAAFEDDKKTFSDTLVILDSTTQQIKSHLAQNE